MTFFVILFYGITFFCLLPIILKDWSFSLYFQDLSKVELQERARKLNDVHLAIANEYLGNLDAQVSYRYHQNLQSQESVDLAIGITTIPRKHDIYNTGYLTQTFTKLHEEFLMDNQSFPRKVLFICDVFDSGPEIHEEAQALNDYIPIFREHRSTDFSTINDEEKHKMHYVQCMRKALSFKPKHVLLIDDDTIPRKNIFSKMRYLIDKIESSMPKTIPQKLQDKLVYTKLYYPQKWSGFGNDYKTLFELLAIGSMGAPLVGTLILMAVKKSKRISHQNLAYILGEYVHPYMIPN